MKEERERLFIVRSKEIWITENRGGDVALQLNLLRVV